MKDQFYLLHHIFEDYLIFIKKEKGKSTTLGEQKGKRICYSKE